MSCAIAKRPQNWRLELNDHATGEAGTINSWAMNLQVGEPTATTDANGNFLISDLPFGTYALREALEIGWAPTIDHYVLQANIKKRAKRLKLKTA